jgi:hypothetical protein
LSLIISLPGWFCDVPLRMLVVPVICLAFVLHLILSKFVNAVFCVFLQNDAPAPKVT